MNEYLRNLNQEIQKYLDMGIDCILTNNYLAVKNVLGK